MYAEEYENKGFPIKNFIMKLILVIIFVALLVWLLPKFISPTVVNESKNNCNGATCDMSGLNALTSQIFSDNLEKMKNAAISYYTDERLPQEIGKSSQMTLSDMIGKKIITPLIDKNNKAVDVEKSYVKITKANDEYILKVNLKDSEKEDYILVHLGCYTYCDKYLCEKEPTKTPIKNAKPNPVVPIKPTTSPSPTPTTTPTPTVPTNPQCKVVNGKYYDKNGNVTNEVNYIISCQAPICKQVNGYYFGKNGNNVSKATFDSECGSQIVKCEYKNGNYYDKNGNITSEVNYIISCQAPICKQVNGYYFGIRGNNVSKATFDSECSTPVEYVYEYKKTTNAKLSAWTSWSNWQKTSCATKEVNCNDNDINCRYKLQRLNRKEKIGTYQKTYAKQRSVIKQTGSYQQKSCANYNYVEINRTTYATTTTTTYTTINTITTTTQQSSGGWTYNGRASYSNPPRDTNTTQYKFVGADYSYCGDTCTTLPNYYYDSYTYSGGLTSVSSTTTPGNTTSSSSSNKVPVGSSTSYEASCGSYVYKTIPIYSTITVTEKANRTEPLYGEVCYQSTKSRQLISSGSTQTTWSNYNNRSLLDNGWVYTGRRKVK